MRDITVREYDASGMMAPVIAAPSSPHWTEPAQPYNQLGLCRLRGKRARTLAATIGALATKIATKMSSYL